MVSNFCCFHPYLGKIPIWAYFSNGLKPPTTCSPCFTCTSKSFAPGGARANRMLKSGRVGFAWFGDPGGYGTRGTWWAWQTLGWGDHKTMVMNKNPGSCRVVLLFQIDVAKETLDTSSPTGDTWMKPTKGRGSVVIPSVILRFAIPGWWNCPLNGNPCLNQPVFHGMKYFFFLAHVVSINSLKIPRMKTCW